MSYAYNIVCHMHIILVHEYKHILLPSKCHARRRSKFKPRNQKTAFTVARQNTACIAYIIGIHGHGQEVDISWGALHVHITLHPMFVWKTGCHPRLSTLLGEEPGGNSASNDACRDEMTATHGSARLSANPNIIFWLEMSPMFRYSIFMSRPISK